MMKRAAYFFNLVDHEVMDKCGSYDKALVYASFIRQLLGFIFVFLVFLYAWSTVFPLAFAIITATICSLIVLFLDQAIIGSEWSLKHNAVNQTASQYLVTPVLKFIRLLPRIIYAVVIALFIATLAELALQSKAIDRVLVQETKQSNTDYFNRKEALQKAQKTELKSVDDEISTLKQVLSNRENPTSETTIKSLRESINKQEENIQNVASSIARLQSRRISILEVRKPLQSEVEIARAEETAFRELMEDELEPPKCAVPGANVCKGERFIRARQNMIVAQNKAATLEPKLAANIKEESEISSSLATLTVDVETLKAKLGIDANALSKLSTDQRTPDEIRKAIVVETTKRALLEEKHIIDTQAFEGELKSGGFFTTAEFDILDRYVGLQKLHDDLEKGEAAKRFSWGLTLVIILFELSPVLVSVFFAPYSFYANQMRLKRVKAESDTTIELMKIKSAELKAAAEAAAEDVEARISVLKSKDRLTTEEQRTKKTWWSNVKSSSQYQRARFFNLKKDNDIAETTHEDKMNLRRKRNI